MYMIVVILDAHHLIDAIKLEFEFFPFGHIDLNAVKIKVLCKPFIAKPATQIVWARAWSFGPPGTTAGTALETLPCWPLFRTCNNIRT